MCIVQKKKERKKTKSVFSKNKTFPQKRKVELMNNTYSYICIHTAQMTSTTNKDRSSNNVVRTRKTFRWNNKKKKQKKKEDLYVLPKKDDRCFILLF